jgi:signal transduction histidine kinase
VRAVAEAHGGRVELYSRPGAGARFTIAIPTHPPQGV